jgi:hypothetical protein
MDVVFSVGTLGMVDDGKALRPGCTQGIIPKQQNIDVTASGVSRSVIDSFSTDVMAFTEALEILQSSPGYQTPPPPPARKYNCSYITQLLPAK